MKYLVDLFCGIGGVSTGFSQEGYKVHAVVDLWDKALKVHEANHPDSKHLNLELGTETAKKAVIENMPKLKRGDTLHIHGSPPCQNLSSINMYRDAEKGLAMTLWTLDFLMQLGKSDKRITWSIEQVPFGGLISLLKEIQKEHPIHFHVFHMEEYGVCQKRKRLIISNVDVQILVPKQPCESIEKVLSVPRGARFITNGNVSHRNLTTPNKALCLRDLKSKPVHSYTIVTASLWFLDKDKVPLRKYTIEEKMAIQTLPEGYFDGQSLIKKDLNQMIANCVPSGFARQLAKGIDLYHQK